MINMCVCKLVVFVLQKMCIVYMHGVSWLAYYKIEPEAKAGVYHKIIIGRTIYLCEGIQLTSQIVYNVKKKHGNNKRTITSK